MCFLNRLYALVGWAMVALGGLHMFATFRLPAASPASRVWFFGTGIAMALVGAVNLLHRTYGQSAFGLRVVCWIANAFLTLFAIVACTIIHAGIRQWIVIVGLLVAALIFSFFPAVHAVRDQS